MTDDHGLLALDRSECLTLLGSVPVGRLVHTARALPAVWPFNFVLLPGAVYLRTSRGSGAWRAADGGAVVAFEADDVNAEGRYGWSVVVIGRAALVTDEAALQQLSTVLGSPSAAGVREEVVCITHELVDGRRAGGAARLQASVLPGVAPLRG